MKARIYSYASGEQETIAEIEIINGKLVFSGLAGDRVKHDLSQRKLFNFVEGKPDERAGLRIQNSLFRMYLMVLLGSITKAELVGVRPSSKNKEHR